MKARFKKLLYTMEEYCQTVFRFTFTSCFVSIVLYACQHIGVATIGQLLGKFFLALIVSTLLAALFSWLIDCLMGKCKKNN
ncbi:MAG: hypothetical protein E7446_07190 [Ruminococcaceae bacterium]|nr:hypothetical protein [Oscillospiraceae bacterium]